MVIRLLILAFFILSPCVVFGADPGCLDCHLAHYEGLGNCSFCHRGIQNARRKDIAHYRLIRRKYAFFRWSAEPVVKQGKKLLSAYACKRCHVSGQEGNFFAANLDSRSRDLLPEEMNTAIKTPAAFMPVFHFSPLQRVAIVNRILFNGAATQDMANEVPIVIHFEQQKNAENDQFSKHCGGCHKMLTLQHGGLGMGAIGPNLSGLLTKFYPPTFRDKELWNPDNLREWLKNPRQIKKMAQMPPVLLQKKEIIQLLELMGVSQTPVQAIDD